MPLLQHFLHQQALQVRIALGLSNLHATSWCMQLPCLPLLHHQPKNAIQFGCLPLFIKACLSIGPMTACCRPAFVACHAHYVSAPCNIIMFQSQLIHALGHEAHSVLVEPSRLPPEHSWLACSQCYHLRQCCQAVFTARSLSLQG